MKKKLLLFSLFPVSVLSAQDVISSQGDSYSNGSNTVDFTIGEPIIETVGDGTNDLTQGFHQTLLIITNLEDYKNTFDVSIYPNPSSEYVGLNVEKFENLSYHLYDINGKLLNNASLNNKSTKINMIDFAKGTYLLTLIDQENNKLKTYQIIKR